MNAGDRAMISYNQLDSLLKVFNLLFGFEVQIIIKHICQSTKESIAGRAYAQLQMEISNEHGYGEANCVLNVNKTREEMHDQQNNNKKKLFK